MIPTCRELIDFLDDYVEHRLPMARRLMFQAHLAGCRDCRAYLDSYRRTIALARQSGAEPAPVPEDLVRAILSVLNSGDGPR